MTVERVRVRGYRLPDEDNPNEVECNGCGNSVYIEDEAYYALLNEGYGFTPDIECAECATRRRLMGNERGD